ncbi:MAG: DNA repair protein RecO [Candidatus Portnoybacteria bacterium]|jgi:DNA repair protein RecO (recombination protein O)|nr:DNA repair protein RecO [Candidatus Portnoybacteria bacterium]
MVNKISVYKTEGIILKAADLGELDRLLTIYTNGYGKIQARAISARKKESKLAGNLQPFTHARFLLAKSKTIDIVTDVSVINGYLQLHHRLENLSHAFYFAELIDKLVAAPEPDDNLWRLVCQAFSALNQRRDDWSKLKAAFEEKFLEYLGHPSFKTQNKTTEQQHLHYLESLAGERINSYKFLNFVK